MEQPESKYVAKPFITYIKNKYNWQAYRTNGNKYQSGFPDWYLTHAKYSPKWIECKHLTLKLDGSPSYSVQFTQPQRVVFPQWMSHGVGIWIIAHNNLIGNLAELERQYSLLFKPANCYDFLSLTQRKLKYGR